MAGQILSVNSYFPSQILPMDSYFLQAATITGLLPLGNSHSQTATNPGQQCHDVMMDSHHPVGNHFPWTINTVDNYYPSWTAIKPGQLLLLDNYYPWISSIHGQLLSSDYYHPWSTTVSRQLLLPLETYQPVHLLNFY